MTRKTPRCVPDLPGSKTALPPPGGARVCQTLWMNASCQTESSTERVAFSAVRNQDVESPSDQYTQTDLTRISTELLISSAALCQPEVLETELKLLLYCLDRKQLVHRSSQDASQ